MAKKTKTPRVTETTHFRHEDAKRKNIPTAPMAAEGKVPRVRRVKYAYSPHLDPVLRFDPAGRADKVAAIVDKACRGERLSAAEQEILKAVGKNWEQPWLEWASKQEEHARGHFAVDPVALHIHERISAQAILRNAMREDAQRSLFAVPEQTYAEALQFYKHDVDWANRLILGDGLQVMSSLANRESLAGRVQTIYVDPPYGIRFASNFQPEVGQKDIAEGNDADLTREPEMVTAFRDTWRIGTHSYLSYLRHRLVTARELLARSGSLFLQISQDNLHRVRLLLDEIFGSDNFAGLITYRTGVSAGASGLDVVVDYVIWYAKNRSEMKYHDLLTPLDPGEEGATRYTSVEDMWTGASRLATDDERRGILSDAKRFRLFTDQGLTSRGVTSGATMKPFVFGGRQFAPPAGHWRTTPERLAKLADCDRIIGAGATVRFRKCFEDSPTLSLTNLWSDTGGGIQSRSDPKVYVVQTTNKIVERCILMTSDPGDLVLDPTCGSGTTAYVAEKWGRRWITIDTSRVALSVARQRLLTATFDHFRTKGGPEGVVGAENPASGFVYRTVPDITLKSIAQNVNLDPILARHAAVLATLLKAANAALEAVPDTLVRALAAKIKEKQKRTGKRSVTEVDRRRWLLPPNNRDPRLKWTVDSSFVGWYDWEVPFDTDPDWPKPLQEAVLAYRVAWRAKMEEVNRCIADNADYEALVDQPEIVKDVVRVSGPFSVEGVIPEQLSLTDDGMADLTPNEFEDTGQSASDPQNISAFLSRMTAHLKSDGLTFLNNKRRKFEHLDAAFEDGSGSFIHAEGAWEGEPDSLVGVTFGPQYGPITALQVEEAIRAAKRYTDLVIAGFSFDAVTYAIVEGQQHPKLRIHIAQIRPDLNEAMDGLLKNTPNSQLFTVFGQPDIDVKHTKNGWVCTLRGVDIYNPTDNTLRSSGADKVSAWFLDSDYDGRCFCATQAFFPNRDAWEKIGKALGSQADSDAFEAFGGTVSLPFEKGKFGRIAVKVIDPRGNEVMAIRKLK